MAGGREGKRRPTDQLEAGETPQGSLSSLDLPGAPNHTESLFAPLFPCSHIVPLLRHPPFSGPKRIPSPLPHDNFPDCSGCSMLGVYGQHFRTYAVPVSVSESTLTVNSQSTVKIRRVRGPSGKHVGWVERWTENKTAGQMNETG